MLTVTGKRTSIVQALLKMVPGEGCREIENDLADPRGALAIPAADRYILAAGVLHGQTAAELDDKQVVETLAVNYVNVVRICEIILRREKCARICVIGSESGYLGSFDQVYAASKAALHAYVMNRAPAWPQQLFAVSPAIISDSGMTLRRIDYPEVLRARRTVTAAAVAATIHRHLYDISAEPLTAAVVRLSGQLPDDVV